MFKRRIEASSEPLVHGWRLTPLEWLAERLTQDQPLVATMISGVTHSIQIDGEAYRRNISLGTEETSFTGYMNWPEAEVQGTISLTDASDEKIEDGVIGRLSITTLDADPSKLRPVLQFHLTMLDQRQLVALRTSFQSALCGQGQASANFVIRPIPDKDEWLRFFEEHGYSQSLWITRVYLNAVSGQSVND